MSDFGVYRPEPTVRLLPTGIAALITVAAALVSPAPAAKVAPNVDSAVAQQALSRKQQGWFAWFAPADPVYNYQGRQVQPAAAYYREPTNYKAPPPWFASLNLKDKLYVPYFAQAATQSRMADQRNEQAALRKPWSGLFAPPDPAYNYTGPSVQAVASYYREAARYALAAPAVLPPPVAAQVPYILAQQPPQTREARAEWKSLGPWFALFAPADPVYSYSGAQLQAAGAYLREPGRVSSLPTFAIPSQSAGVPYVTAAQPWTAPRDTRTEWQWIMEPWWANFAPPDPPQLIAARPTIDAAYLRTAFSYPPTAVVALPQGQPVAQVPYAPTAQPGSALREARTEWTDILAPWFAPYAVDPSSVPAQRLLAYAEMRRDAGSYAIPVAWSAPFSGAGPSFFQWSAVVTPQPREAAWTRLPGLNATAFAPADPVYNFTGPTIRRDAAYFRVETNYRLPAPWVFPPTIVATLTTDPRYIAIMGPRAFVVAYAANWIVSYPIPKWTVSE